MTAELVWKGKSVMNQKEIDRINALARKAKTEGLSAQEITERDELRKRYIADMRAAVQDQLAHTVVLRPDGTREPLLKKDVGGKG